jgi:hypothetical protein
MSCHWTTPQGGARRIDRGPAVLRGGRERDSPRGARAPLGAEIPADSALRGASDAPVRRVCKYAALCQAELARPRGPGDRCGQQRRPRAPRSSVGRPSPPTPRRRRRRSARAEAPTSPRRRATRRRSPGRRYAWSTASAPPGTSRLCVPTAPCGRSPPARCAAWFAGTTSPMSARAARRRCRSSRGRATGCTPRGCRSRRTSLGALALSPRRPASSPPGWRPPRTAG